MTAAGLHLIVRLAGERIALPAAELNSVVEIDSLTAVPLAAPHVAGLAALRSRVLTVIDGCAALGLEPGPHSGEAVMLECDGYGYAVLVDAVEDAIDIAHAIEPICAAPAPHWARVARGIVSIDDDALLVVSPAALVAGPDAPAPAAVNPALTPTA